MNENPYPLTLSMCSKHSNYSVTSFRFVPNLLKVSKIKSKSTQQWHMCSLDLKLKVISRITSKCTAITFCLKGTYHFSTFSSQMASFCSLSYSLFVTPSFETFCSLNLIPDWGPYIWAFHFFPFLAEFGSVLALDNHLASDLWAIQSHQWKVSAL